MLEFRNRMADPDTFLLGVELVTTRGTMEQKKARQTCIFAADLARCDRIDWVSITDNAGGNPQLGPMTLGKPILYAGKEVVIHLSCKDYNRNGLESEAWQLASEGFHNILALSGDAPVIGYEGRPKPVFDTDSVGLLTLLSEMNDGLGVRTVTNGTSRNYQLESTNFFIGAVTTNFKRDENELIPQYLKLEKKIECGAQFIICQIGYDSKKAHEQKVYLDNHGLGDTPLIGNVFVLSGPIAQFFRTGKIPGIVISDELAKECERQSATSDKGRQFFMELAAKQIAIFKGLGYHGAYLGGVNNYDQMNQVLDLADRFSDDDWKTFAKEISYSRRNEFFLYATDETSGLIDPDRLNPDYQASLQKPRRPRSVSLTYRLSKRMHDSAFTPGKPLFNFAKKIYEKSAKPEQGPVVLRVLEKASKSILFGCKDCGDCSLPDIAFRCPESACAKNQRNGPCGGTRDGQCEVYDIPCIWSIAYDRLKYAGEERDLLKHAPVIQNESLRGTSSWSNMFLGKDHHSQPLCKPKRATAQCTGRASTLPSYLL